MKGMKRKKKKKKNKKKKKKKELKKKKKNKLLKKYIHCLFPFLNKQITKKVFLFNFFIINRFFFLFLSFSKSTLFFYSN